MALKQFLALPGRGLEIGMGTERFAVPLGIEVGLEPTAAMADPARRRGIRVVRSVGEALPFRGDSFDLVAMVIVLWALSFYRPHLKIGPILTGTA